MAPVVKCLFNKHKALSSNPHTAKKNKKRENVGQQYFVTL
jgi:hypothetical protein